MSLKDEFNWSTKKEEDYGKYLNGKTDRRWRRYNFNEIRMENSVKKNGNIMINSFKQRKSKFTTKWPVIIPNFEEEKKFKKKVKKRKKKHKKTEDIEEENPKKRIKKMNKSQNWIKYKLAKNLKCLIEKTNFSRNCKSILNLKEGEMLTLLRKRPLCPIPCDYFELCEIFNESDRASMPFISQKSLKLQRSYVVVKEKRIELLDGFVSTADISSDWEKEYLEMKKKKFNFVNKIEDMLLYLCYFDTGNINIFICKK